MIFDSLPLDLYWSLNVYYLSKLLIICYLNPVYPYIPLPPPHYFFLSISTSQCCLLWDTYSCTAAAVIKMNSSILTSVHSHFISLSYLFLYFIILSLFRKDHLLLINGIFLCLPISFPLIMRVYDDGPHGHNGVSSILLLSHLPYLYDYLGCFLYFFNLV